MVTTARRRNIVAIVAIVAMYGDYGSPRERPVRCRHGEPPI
jgi:hypothetical protein